MSRCIKNFALLGLIFFMFAGAAHSQTRKDLESRKAQLQRDIELTNKLLEETQMDKKTTLNQLRTLRKKISIREELIRTINTELGMLDNQIISTADSIVVLEAQLKKLKDEYAKMIYFAYKNQNAYQRMMFLFAAKDFNQAYKRMKYLQQYSAHRKMQAEQIVGTSNELNQKKEELEARKKQKSSLLGSELQEKKVLASEQGQQENLAKGLQAKEKKLKQDLKTKQEAAARLNRAIEDVIRREIEAARKKAEAEGKKAAPGVSALAMTPEAAKLSADFSGNRGSLPWPVDQGVITSTFGDHPHPVLRGIMTKNNGVDISTRKGTIARAVFEGTVSGVVIIPGANKAVIVRHGEYLSVYSNLDEVYVKMGDKLSTKQSIGLVHTNEEDSKTELHLEIWKSTTKLDPSDWLFRK